MGRCLLLLGLLGLAACGDKGEDPVGTGDEGGESGGDGDDCASRVWFADRDGDGYGDPADRVESCEELSGYVNNEADCDDADAAVNPDASEICSGADEDCDGLVDDEDPSNDPDTEQRTWVDGDGDGWGEPDSLLTSCVVPEGRVLVGEDCNDGNADIYPGAPEVCLPEDTDDDCDGLVDEEDDSFDLGSVPTWYLDADGDGYGTEDSTLQACSLSSSIYVAEAGDCDDGDGDVSPVATESCDNGADDDCDGLLDCEDGDCAGVCSETDCADGQDEDYDGFTDCADDECWGLPECAAGTRSVWVDGGGSGEMKIFFEGAMEVVDCSGCGSFSQATTSTRRLLGEVHAIYGLVQLRLGSSGTASTCTWDMGKLTWAGSSSFSTSVGGATSRVIRPGEAVRTGVGLRSPCGLSSATFELPGWIFASQRMGAGMGTASGELDTGAPWQSAWYQPTRTWTHYNSARSSVVTSVTGAPRLRSAVWSGTTVVTWGLMGSGAPILLP